MNPVQALGCCCTLIIFAVIGQRLRMVSAHRAQQVVLATVVFDPEGKLLVTPEGRLPCRKIANTSLERVGGGKPYLGEEANAGRRHSAKFSMSTIKFLHGCIVLLTTGPESLN